MIFVTRDEKEDWYDHLNHGRKFPSFSLIEEFYKNTGGQKILILSPMLFMERFLPVIQKEPLTNAAKEAIEEIRNLPDIKEVSSKIQRIPVVKKINDKIINISSVIQEGVVEFVLNRATSYFSLKIPFILKDCVQLRITSKFIENPDHTPQFSLSCGIGVHQDFNLHLKSIESNQNFPPGKYRLFYSLNKTNQDMIEENMWNINMDEPPF